LRAVIPPHYRDLVADAALQSYWRKRALAQFLKRCGVKESFLATLAAEESKRDLLHRLFPRLEETAMPDFVWLTAWRTHSFSKRLFQI
jgi:hypothetical protein